MTIVMVTAEFCEDAESRELWALNRWIVWYMNYISIKLLVFKRIFK